MLQNYQQAGHWSPGAAKRFLAQISVVDVLASGSKTAAVLFKSGYRYRVAEVLQAGYCKVRVKTGLAVTCLEADGKRLSLSLVRGYQHGSSRD